MDHRAISFGPSSRRAAQSASAEFEPLPFLLDARQPGAQHLRPVGEMPKQDAALAERRKQPGRIGRLKIAKQRRCRRRQATPKRPNSASSRAASSRQAPPHVGLPAAVGKRADAIFQRRAGDRPRPELRLQPLDRQRVGKRKAEPQAGQAKELAEGAQHDDAALPDIAGKAFRARADIHERLVDDQQPAFGAQFSGKLEQPVPRDDTPVRDCWD